MSTPPSNINDDFDQVAQQVPLEKLGNAIGAAFQSDAMPPIG